MATTPMGSITEQAPYSYYAVTKESVATKFMLHDNTISYSIAANKLVTGSDLVIDPSLEWATYYYYDSLAAPYQIGTIVTGVVTDKLNNVYMLGMCRNNSLATSGAYQTIVSGPYPDVFLVKFDSTGSRLWATYYGGSSVEYSGSIACDAGNNIYISGATISGSGIATSGAYHSSRVTSYEFFLAKFTASGSLSWGTYTGIPVDSNYYYNYSLAPALSCDASNNVYMAGATDTTNNVATSGAYQTSNGGGVDAFLLKFSSSGSRLWGTYFGGAGADRGHAVACDGNGNVYLGGETTSSTGIATSGSHQPTAGSTDNGFLAKFNSSGGLQYATYYGGSSTDYIEDIACDASNNIYVSGIAYSTNNISTSGAYQTANAGSHDAFVAKFNSSGVRQWGSYFGGTSDEFYTQIAISNSNKVFLTGITTSSSGIATSNGYQNSYNGGGDLFLAEFSPSGNTINWASYYGGTNIEYPYFTVYSGSINYNYRTGLACSNDAGVYISGITQSTNGIATSGAFQSSAPYISASKYSAFLAKFISDTAVFIHQPFADTVFCAGDSMHIHYDVTASFNSNNNFTLQLSDASGSFASPVNIGVRSDVTTGIINGRIPANTAGGTGYRMRVVASNPTYTSADEYYNIRIKAAPANFSLTSNTPVCEADTIRLTGNTSSTGVSWQWRGPNAYSSNAQNNKIGSVTASMAGYYIITATLTATGCSLKDSQNVVVNPLPAKPVASSNTPLCTGASLALTATSTTSGVSWQWTGPNSFSSTLQNPSKASMTVSDGGNYIVSAILNGCITKDTTNVLVYPVTPAPIASNNGPACINSNVMLYASNVAGASYSWIGPGSYTSAQQNPVISRAQNTDAGVYTVIATANGCPSVAATTTVVLTTGPDVKIYPTPGDSVCNGKPVTVTAIVSNAGSAPSYQWLKNGNPVSGATNVSYKDFGVVDGDSYQLMLTPGTGAPCTSPVYSINIPITVLQYQVPFVSMTASDSNAWPGLLINFNATAGNAGNYPKYQWMVNSKNILGATAGNWGTTTLSNGDSVCVLMTSSYLCPDPATVKACKVVKIATGITDASATKINVYPNPVNGVLHIDGLSKGTQIQLNDIYGRVVYKATAAKDKETINTANLGPGSYLLQLTTSDGRKVGYKVVVD